MSEHDDELRALRERAYGPAADIHGDDDALVRLRALEARQRAASGRHPAAVSADEAYAAEFLDSAFGAAEADSAGSEASASSAAPSGSAGRRTRRAEAPTSPPEGDAGADADPGVAASAPTARPWWRRRMPLLWAASLIVAALLGAAATVSLQAALSGQVAVLHVDEDGELPETLGEMPGEVVVFDELAGLTVITTAESRYAATEQPMTCLYVLNDGEMGMFLGGNCGADRFPATATLLVDANAPQELQERFEVGTVLLFELDGSQVRVYAASPQNDTEPTPEQENAGDS